MDGGAILWYLSGMPQTMPLRVSRERAEQASVLRSCGFSWSEIAKALGFTSVGGAQQAVASHRARNPLPTAEDTLTEILDRRRVTTSAGLQQLAQAAAAGDATAVAGLIRALTAADSETAKLYGLHAPEKHQHLVAVAPADAISRLRGELLDTIDAEVVEQ